MLGGLERILWRRQDLKWDCGGSGGFGHLVRSSEGKAQREEQFEQRLAALNLGMLVACLGKSSLLSWEVGIKGLEW